MQAPEDIGVIVVNWNGWRHTRACVEALERTEGPSWRAYVVDNASSDDSLQRLADLGPRAELIASPVNGGWTGGNNLGVQRALSLGHPYLFVLNNDAFVRRDTLAVLLAAHRAAGSPAPVLGPVHCDGQGKAYSFIGADFDPYTGLPGHRPVQGVAPADLPSQIPTDYILGAGIFAAADQFRRVGLFDDDFFLNFDDTDWCVRAKAGGMPLMLVREAVIDHVGSAAIGGRESPLQRYFMTRNGLLFLRRWRGLRYCYRLLKVKAWDFRQRFGRAWPIALARSRDPADLAFKRGVADYLAGRFGDCPPLIRELQSRGRSA